MLLLAMLAVLAVQAGCAQSAPPPAARAVPDQQETLTAPEPASASAAPATATATATPAPTARLGEGGFWRLVDDARRNADGDTERQSELLEERLSQLPAEQIAEYGAMYRRLDERAYTWDLWAAAYVIEDGCSDDCFRDFRAYLISLGGETYEAALANPDALAPIVEDAERGDWENADDVAPDAYEEVAGEDIPSGDSDVSGRPSGEAWDDEQQDELIRRYPALADRFR